METKLCECGCGQPAPLAVKTNKIYGWIQGQPKRFIHNHHNYSAYPHSPEGQHFCSECQQHLPVENFYRNPAVKSGLSRVCKPCATVRTTRSRQKNPEAANARQRAWALKNPERARARGRKAALKRKYGLTPEDVNEMLEEQNGLCGICRKALDVAIPRSIHVDHCHKGGRVRGILCQDCNIMLGNAKDNPETLRRAADYLS